RILEDDATRAPAVVRDLRLRSGRRQRGMAKISRPGHHPTVALCAIAPRGAALPLGEGADHATGTDSMSEILTYIDVGARVRATAVRARAGAAPGLFWLGGFKSDMKGTKAEALARFAADKGRGLVRFDYSGHGESRGEFVDGTIGRWLEES